MQRNWIGRSEGAEIDFPVQGRRGSAEGLHDAARHALRGDLHGPRPGTPDGGVPHDARTGVRRPGVRRHDRPEERHGEDRPREEEERRVHRRLRRESRDRRDDPRLDRRLRPPRLRDRRHHGRPRPRPARLRIRRAVRPPGRRGGQGRRPFAGGVHRRGDRDELQRPGDLDRRAPDARRHGEDDGVGRIEGDREIHRPVQAPRLALLAPALLGRAVPAGLPGGRLRRGARRIGPPGPASRPRVVPADGVGRIGPRHRRRLVVHRPPGARAAAAGNPHDAPVGGLLLVLPPVPRPAQRQGIRLPREGTLLDAGRPLRGRGRARGAAPALREVLAQGALRPRPPLHDASRSPG